MTRRERKALELWREWFRWSGDPWEVEDQMGRVGCFFCIADQPNHEPDCIYLAAWELVHGTRELSGE